MAKSTFPDGFLEGLCTNALGHLFLWGDRGRLLGTQIEGSTWRSPVETNSERVFAGATPFQNGVLAWGLEPNGPGFVTTWALDQEWLNERRFQTPLPSYLPKSFNTMKLTALLLMANFALVADTDETRGPQSGALAPKTTQTNQIATEIRRLAGERSKALVGKDIAALERILAPEFIYTNASGALMDKETYLSRYVRNPKVKWHSQEIDDITVRVFGDSVVVTCRVKDHAEFDGHLLNAAFRSTYVYVRTTVGWQCVTGHTGPAGE